MGNLVVLLIVAAVLIIGSLCVLPMHRPALLADAEWGKPETAAAFNHRFGKGSSEKSSFGAGSLRGDSRLTKGLIARFLNADALLLG